MKKECVRSANPYFLSTERAVKPVRPSYLLQNAVAVHIFRMLTIRVWVPARHLRSISGHMPPAVHPAVNDSSKCNNTPECYYNHELRATGFHLRHSGFFRSRRSRVPHNGLHGRVSASLQVVRQSGELYYASPFNVFRAGVQVVIGLPCLCGPMPLCRP